MVPLIIWRTAVTVFYIKNKIIKIRTYFINKTELSFALFIDTIYCPLQKKALVKSKVTEPTPRSPEPFLTIIGVRLFCHLNPGQ